MAADRPLPGSIVVAGTAFVGIVATDEMPIDRLWLP